MKLTTRLLQCLVIGLILYCSITSATAGNLEKDFISPPATARPWVYWFWINGNISREGITADLEAMRRVGIGGVLIMEVDQRVPAGPVGFMSAEWRGLFKHAVSEAQRLGIEVNMNNDAGWNGSGGPWIKPEQSMQKVVWSEVDLVGPRHFEDVLPQPQTVADFYRDIAVLAFPTPGSYRIPDIKVRAGYQVGGVGPLAENGLSQDMMIDRAGITDISTKIDSAGRLIWDVPPGKWTIVRFGHTSTGVENAPAPASGRGLECDKLSEEGAEANFNGMMAKLVTDVGPAAGKALVATHVDSWENGAQNWTARMREEFERRSGYDPLPFLPVITGRVVGSLEMSDRFLWDLRRTISEMVIENYAGHLRELAHARGLRFTIEAYGGPCDDIPYGGEADEPMGEFWVGGGALETCKGMASAAHVYGKPVVGAEAFTAGGQERWRDYPASIKALGDQAFCTGINRFVFHRYALQPWAQDRRPGMTMGPWGTHYERTQTWWEQTPAWHTYLARCQYLLRQGKFAADICYLQSETPPQAFNAHKRMGYDWDECSAEAVITRMSVKNGRIVLPDGMSYRLLVLPESQAMTPRLLRKIRDLVEAGATVVGRRPMRSPSLSNYPACDEEIKSLSDELWGDVDGKRIKERRFGRGRVVCGIAPEDILAKSGVGPDFSCRDTLRYIHRAAGSTDIYFVANPQPYELMTTVTFRISGKTPELWWPDTGRIERAAVYEEKNGVTNVALPLGPSGSVFVVFRKSGAKSDSVVAVTRDGKPVISTAIAPLPKIVVEKAVYGVLNDPNRTRDVRDKAQSWVDGGERELPVSRMADGDDPAYGVVKTLVLECTIDGKRASFTGKDANIINLTLASMNTEPVCEVHSDGRQIKLDAWKPGKYTLIRASGRKSEVTVPPLPALLNITGPWTVLFPPDKGAPQRVELDNLISWSEHPDPGVKYFSGTATYRTVIDVPKGLFAKGRVLRLDLGDVQVIARVKLNGKDLGVLWKPPFIVTVNDVLKPGRNELEVQVTNLWPNRMIGDEQLPEDSDRHPDGTLKSWPQWLLDGKPSPTGRHTFASWRLWKKDDALLSSGLIGPVRITVGREFALRLH